MHVLVIHFPIEIRSAHAIEVHMLIFNVDDVQEFHTYMRGE